MIYLDNSATTKPDEAVMQSFNRVATEFYANPSSIHQSGAEVEKLQSAARKQAAEILHIDPEEIIFTSGGTEGNNLAIKGVALKYRDRGKHIVTTEVEHASVYEAVHALQELGFEVTFLPVDNTGCVNPSDVIRAIREDTILVSIMHVNNEIGSIQPIDEIGEMLKEYPKLFFHVDAVQSLGKLPINLHSSSIDLCTFSGHKINGLKGTGILYKRAAIKLFPLLHGGGQERGLRSGTENVAGNVSFVRALRLAKEKERNNSAALQTLRNKLLDALEKNEYIKLNSPREGAPHIVHFSLPGLKPETVIHALYEKGFAVSTQSACSSKAADQSRVLTSCGKTKAEAVSGIRVSLSYETTEAEINLFLAAFSEAVNELKQIFGVDNNGI